MVKKKITREYIFTEKEIKKLFNLKGEIIGLRLLSGLSPKDEDEGVSKDKTKWLLETFEMVKE